METTESNNNSLRISTKIICLECLTDTTIHALPNISKSSNHLGLKVIWTICLFACSGYCLYCCVQTFQN